MEAKKNRPSAGCTRATQQRMVVGIICIFALFNIWTIVQHDRTTHETIHDNHAAFLEAFVVDSAEENSDNEKDAGRNTYQSISPLQSNVNIAEPNAETSVQNEDGHLQIDARMGSSAMDRVSSQAAAIAVDPITTTAVSTTAVSKTAQTDQSKLPLCRVAVFNNFDYHYELLESIVIRYPLPWDTLQCDYTSQPVQFDIAFQDNRKITNEKKGWKEYYFQHLNGTIRERNATNTNTVVQARFGVVWRYEDFVKRAKTAYIGTKEHIDFHAQIVVSCAKTAIDKINSDVIRRKNNEAKIKALEVAALRQQASNNSTKKRAKPMRKYIPPFCVNHVRDDENCFNPEVSPSRCCWLNPMHPECFFIPSDFPQFPGARNERCRQFQQSNQTLRLCISGGARRHIDLATIIEQYQQEQHHRHDINYELVIHQRHDKPPKFYNDHNVPITIENLSKFYEYERSMAHCDVLLPMITPQHNPGYFPPVGKLSGCLAQAIGYQIPTVMHEQLRQIYEPYLATTWTYNDTHPSLKAAFVAMLQGRKAQLVAECGGQQAG